jgi:hypothetical protein
MQPGLTGRDPLVTFGRVPGTVVCSLGDLFVDATIGSGPEHRSRGVSRKIRAETVIGATAYGLHLSAAPHDRGPRRRCHAHRSVRLRGPRAYRRCLIPLPAELPWMGPSLASSCAHACPLACGATRALRLRSHAQAQPRREVSRPRCAMPRQRRLLLELLCQRRVRGEPVRGQWGTVTAR